ncbi:EamA family transporter RarD [Pendulispora albinea]|uniref:EamA family transporter RarD n=1 Tax=Pendulispora albinea TaxID=2741071 RepID=A0ABZ2M7Y4_9BACT
MDERRKGVLFGLSAYFMWGFFPLYWPLLKPAGAVEILAHRISWSLVVMALLVMRAHKGSFRWLRELGGRRFGLLVLAAGLISANWAIYIWAVNHQHVVETSLGYFMTPLLSVILGTLFLGERLRRVQWLAIGIAACAVVVLTVAYGQLPWIALGLALSFGLYGFIKKKAGVGALESLAVETGLLVLPAVAYLLVLQGQGTAMFGHVSRGKDLLLAASGVLTAIPLLCFGAAANRIPLATIGLLQYSSPILQFLCGVLIFREDMPASRWAGFALVWIGLGVFTLDSVLARRRASRCTGAALSGSAAKA